MYCPECGTENKDIATFCLECGAKIKPKPKKKNAAIFAFLAVVVIIFLTWAFLSSALFAPMSSASPFGRSQVHVDELTGTQGLQSATIKFNIYNTGDTAAKNVYAKIDLSMDDFKTIFTSKSLFVGTINPGESRPITTEIPLAYTTQKFQFRVIPQY